MPILRAAAPQPLTRPESQRTQHRPQWGVVREPDAYPRAASSYELRACYELLEKASHASCRPLTGRCPAWRHGAFSRCGLPASTRDQGHSAGRTSRSLPENRRDGHPKCRTRSRLVRHRLQSRLAGDEITGGEDADGSFQPSVAPHALQQQRSTTVCVLRDRRQLCDDSSWRYSSSSSFATPR